MKTLLGTPLVPVLLALFLAAGHSPARDDEPVLERETTRHSFELPPGAAPRLVVDNFFGRVEVRRHLASRIDLELTRTVRGRSPEKLEQARREVRLDVTAEAAAVELYVDTPYRERRWRNRDWKWRDPGYRVIYDFVLTVPERIDLEVKTVSDGDVSVSGTRGDFDITNVNGSVEMRGVGGSGSAETVNGGIWVGCEDQLAHGRSPLPVLPATESVEGGRRVIRTDGAARVRVGGGGAQHSFETLTGDVRIRRADRVADLREKEDTP